MLRRVVEGLDRQFRETTHTIRVSANPQVYGFSYPMWITSDWDTLLRAVLLATLGS
jgi:hypothetical protein